MKSLKPPIWGTHIRWMKLCPIAWQIIIDGRYPLQEYSTPAIVEECGKKQHDELLYEVGEWIKRSPETLIFKKEAETKTSFNILLDEEWREVIVRPDGYVLATVSNTLLNLVLEVTTRGIDYVPSEWLTAYMIPFYLSNLRPTFTLLVTPLQTGIYPLTWEGLKNFEKLFKSPPRVDVKPQTCYNCDLRPICPEPTI